MGKTISREQGGANSATIQEKAELSGARADGASGSIVDFELGNFFPYLVRIFYRSVSDAVAQSYQAPFDLRVSEWRTMAVLGPYEALSASEIVTRSSMDKVTVSRAIKGLQGRGLLKRDIDGDDKRRAVLRLTHEGQVIFSQIVPQVNASAEKCLAGLSGEERRILVSLMERVRMNGEAILSDCAVETNDATGDAQK